MAVIGEWLRRGRSGLGCASIARSGIGMLGAAWHPPALQCALSGGDPLPWKFQCVAARNDLRR